MQELSNYCMVDPVIMPNPGKVDEGKLHETLQLAFPRYSQ